LHRLQQAGHSIAGLRSKSWDEFSAADGPVMDIVITVCDSAASESCPLWRGAPLMSHWGMPDPAAAVSDTERAFDDAYHLLRRRIDLLVALPLSGLDEASLQVRLDDIADAQA
jgi:protein-tyrosine-phosphatase